MATGRRPRRTHDEKAREQGRPHHRRHHGIARATAKRFAAEGARVIVTGRNRETLEAARKELGDRAEVIESDAGDERQIAQLFEGLAKTHRRLDVLFLNAGTAKFAPLAEAS